MMSDHQRHPLPIDPKQLDELAYRSIRAAGCASNRAEVVKELLAGLGLPQVGWLIAQYLRNPDANPDPPLRNYLKADGS